MKAHGTPMCVLLRDETEDDFMKTENDPFEEIVEQLRAIRRELRYILLWISVLMGCVVVCFLGLLG